MDRALIPATYPFQRQQQDLAKDEMFFIIFCFFMKKWKPRQFFHFLMHLMQSCIFSPEEQTTSMDKKKVTFLVVWTWNILNTKKQGSLCKMKDKDHFAITRCIRTSCFVSFAVFGWCHWQLYFSIFFLFKGVIVKLSIKTHNRKV